MIHKLDLIAVQYACLGGNGEAHSISSTGSHTLNCVSIQVVYLASLFFRYPSNDTRCSYLLSFGGNALGGVLFFNSGLFPQMIMWPKLSTRYENRIDDHQCKFCKCSLKCNLVI
jgi:hypothetical protein